MKSLFVALSLLLFCPALHAQNTSVYVPKTMSDAFAIPAPVFSKSVAGYISIPEIKGESEQEGRRGQIEIYGLTWGSTTTDEANQKPQATPIFIMKKMDLSTPAILEYYLNGKEIPKLEIQLINTTSQQEIMVSKLLLSDVKIVAFQSSYGDYEQGKEEIIGLHFNSIDMSYTRQNSDHSSGESKSFKFQYAD